MRNTRLNPADGKRQKAKRGPVSGRELEHEVWHALKCLDDIYELECSRLTHIKTVQVLAESRYGQSAFAKGEVIAETLASCITRLSGKAGIAGQFPRVAYLIAGVARGSTLSQVSRQLQLTREHVTRKYRPKAMKILAKEFVTELEQQAIALFS